MASPMLPKTQSPYQRFREPEYDDEPMTPTLIDRDGSALFETWDANLLYAIIYQNDVLMVQKYLEKSPNSIRHIDTLPEDYDPFYKAI